MNEASLSQQRQRLADQFGAAELDFKEAAELLWQARLAGHSSDYLERLVAAIGALDRSALLGAAQRLLDAEGGWLCLASAPAPAAPWQAVK